MSISPLCNSGKDCSGRSDEIHELKSLVIGLTSSLNQFCDVITKRMDDIETNIPMHVAGMIDRKVSEEMRKVKDQFKTELKTVSDRVISLEQSYAGVVKQHHEAPLSNEENVSVVIRNLPESENENISRKVAGLIKDRLHLDNIHVTNVERKRSHRPGKHGIVIAKFQSSEDKRKVMRKKRELKDSRNFKDVYIDHSIPQSQRILNSSLKNIVKAIGENKLQIKGSVVKPNSAGGNTQNNRLNDQTSENTQINSDGQVRSSNYRNNVRGRGNIRGGNNRRGRRF